MSDFGEKTRVQVPAILHLSRLGYKFLSKKNLVWDKYTNILTEQFNTALKRINKGITDSDVQNVFEDIKASLKNDDLGEAFFKKLQKRDGLRLIDYLDVNNNDFYCTYEMPFENEGSDFRPDITIYINGIPLAFIEVKVPNNKEGIEKERKRMDDRLSNPAFTHFFNELQLLIFSNNMEYDNDPDVLVPIQGSFYSTVQRNHFRFTPFREEDLQLLQTVASRDILTEVENDVLKEANAQAIKGSREYITNIDGMRPTNRILTSLLNKERFIFLLDYGFCYVREKDGNGIAKVSKHIMRYPQLLASLALLNKLDQGLRKGIIWHSQGSGKTELSFYLVKTLTDYFYRKREQNARFLFIPDRVDLFKQAKDEFINRGLSARTVSSKKEFKEAIQKPSGINGEDGNLEIMVLNTQKLSEEARVLPTTHYSTNNQTIIIVDECHRSYDENGQFLSNLINIDKNAIIIGLTGTPIILGKDEQKSKALFGNYIHKYFYNQSIADGCTLRLMREEIIKTFYDKLQNIKTSLVQKGITDLNDIYCYPTYIASLADYITEDFKTFKRIHDFGSEEKPTGAMIVCYSNKQAEKITDELKTRGEKAALVTHKVPKTEVDKIIEAFKKTNELDYLVVELMLLTGFDCARLKKMYLLRRLHEHNLLQGLTRVNRPFKNYKFGYIVDFEGIMGEFQKTNEAYLRELNELYGEDVTKEIQIFVDSQDIVKRTKEIDEELFSYDTDNIENFSSQISAIESFEEIRKLKKLLDEAKNLYNVARSSGNGNFYKLDIDTIIKMSREVDRRYDIVKFKEAIKNNNDENKSLILEALASIDFKFIKGKEHELLLADKWRDELKRTSENFERNQDKNDPEYISLYDELRRILSEHDIEEVSREVLEKLERLNSKMSDLNNRDLRIAKKYDEDYKFVRLHKRFREMFKTMGEIEIHDILIRIKEYLDDVILKNSSILNNKTYLQREIQREVYNDFKNVDITLNREQLRVIDNMIFLEYHNEYIGACA